MANRLGIYFIHSEEIDYDNLIYLPVLRSNYLSGCNLIFPSSEKNKNIYYKDLMLQADIFVIEMTNLTQTNNMELKQAITSRKPILALAQKSVGYDAKYQKLLQSVIGYSNEEEFRYFVETFAKNNKDRAGSNITGGDSTLVLGVLK